jgi:tripartite-type tricarboxylate transporter receptor subunit TctC
VPACDIAPLHAPMLMTPVAFGKYIADETEKWGKVVKSAGIKPD